MATGIFATLAEVQRKVHVNASAISNTETYIDQYSTEVESLINVESGTNWSDSYSGLNVDVKNILKMAASEMAALMVEAFDLGAIGRTTAIASANSHLHRYNICLTQLRDKSRTKPFIETAA